MITLGLLKLDSSCFLVAALDSRPNKSSLTLVWMMGFPMPCALARVGEASPALIPWAWGVNGFASVLAPLIATVVGMTWGFRAAGAAALQPQADLERRAAAAHHAAASTSLPASMACSDSCSAL